MFLASLTLLAALTAQPAFDAIVNSVNRENHPEVLARMQAWVDANERDPQAARGLVWMARLLRDDHKDRAARPLLVRAIALGRGGEWELQAEKALADIELDAHEYVSAIARYDRLAAIDSTLWRYVGSSAALHARAEQQRFHILVALLIALILVNAFCLFRGGLRALWPPPRELLWLSPILCVLAIASAGQEEPEGKAVLALSLGIALVLWIGGASARARPFRLRGLAALAGVLELCAVLYCAMIWNGLWEKLVDTIALAPQ